MKSKFVLFAVTLALFAASTASVFAGVEQRTDANANAGQAEAANVRISGTEKPVMSGRHVEEKTGAMAGFTLEDLFGCKPMGEDGHMPVPASGVDKQEPRQPPVQ